uniref:CD248 molecule n=1 Tax=Podarcis muralis TaxID=64176 RepID=A0A670JHT3_PODMU|nr:endosialin [Podarcis muralis]
MLRRRGGRGRPRPRVLLLALLLVAWRLSGAGAQEAQAACGPDGCYAVYFQRRSFLDAWRGCRELGGNLATLKYPEEAAQVAELLRDVRGGGGHAQGPQRLLWIGLQRQPRQCFPQRPLRGFTWTTGDQDTSYTNWARSPSSGVGGPSCAAPRCVVLGELDLQWLDGSCTVPVDGYLCRFSFQGMCAGLAEEEEEMEMEEEEEGGGGGGASTVAYSTPFGPASGALRYVPFGTVAAVTCGRAGPAVSVLCMQKEDGSVAWSKDAPLCREAVYQHSWCEGDNGGCQQLCLDEGSGYSCECHAGYFLLPDGHSCASHTHHDGGADGDACRGRPCQFGCVADGEAADGYRCQCPAGYELGSDGHLCEDLDECAEAPCEHQCENTDGSFVCRCHLGFSPSEEEPGRCADTDECQIPGVCQQMCVNYVGGFECYCTEGYDLEPDGITCSPAPHPPPMATAQSYRGAGFLHHLDDGLGLEMEGELEDGVEEEDDSDHSLALSEHLSVFQDARVASPFFPADPRLVPRMLPATEPPNPKSTAPLLDASPSSRRSRMPPNSTPTAAWGLPTASRSPSPFPVTDAPRDTPSPPSLLADPTSPTAPLAPTIAPPPLHRPPVSADSPGEEESPAVVGGVRAAPPTSAPPATPTPDGVPGRQRRDDRWLLVALLVPICVFVVIMLALGIVYCTRCGAQAKSRSVTQCYRWVISSAGKGGPPTASRPGQPATCRTSV